MLLRPPIPFGSTCQRLAQTTKPIGSSNATASPAKPSRIAAAAARWPATTETATPTAASSANGVRASNHGRQRVIRKVSCDVSPIRFLLEGLMAMNAVDECDECDDSRDLDRVHYPSGPGSGCKTCE